MRSILYLYVVSETRVIFFSLISSAPTGILFRSPKQMPSALARKANIRHSNIFRAISRKFSANWAAIVDTLLGYWKRQELRARRTGADPQPDDEMLMEALINWADEEESPTGRALYDALLQAGCPRGVLADLRADLDVSHSFNE